MAEAPTVGEGTERRSDERGQKRYALRREEQWSWAPIRSTLVRTQRSAAPDGVRKSRGRGSSAPIGMIPLGRWPASSRPLARSLHDARIGREPSVPKGLRLRTGGARANSNPEAVFLTNPGYTVGGRYSACPLWGRIRSSNASASARGIPRIRKRPSKTGQPVCTKALATPSTLPDAAT